MLLITIKREARNDIGLMLPTIAYNVTPPPPPPPSLKEIISDKCVGFWSSVTNVQFGEDPVTHLVDLAVIKDTALKSAPP